jgi:excisionase family DNA binding protein
LSPREASAATGLDRLTILKWVRSGRLPAERVKTPNGPGYEIRPEDLTQALQQPRKRREGGPHAPAPGSIVGQLAEMTATIERLGAEVHDLRGQIYQTESRLREAIRGLPALHDLRAHLYQTEIRLQEAIRRLHPPDGEKQPKLSRIFKKRDEI